MIRTDINSLASRPHFHLLDGLRGVAALAVVIFHFMEVAYTDYSQNFIAHGFLAVDFFFCLSGFVTGYAYDGRIEKMGRAKFLKLRLVRLHPLILFGSVLGLLSFLFDPFVTYQFSYETGSVILIFVCSALLIPFPVMPERYFNLFGLNAPAWSLFWEYVANIAYAFILYKIGKRALLVCTALAAVALCVVSYKAGSLMGGWSKDNIWDGCFRICYSFLAGLLVYRFNWIIKTKLGFAGLSFLLALAFIMPWHQQWNPLTETLVVLFYFPLVVALGAGARFGGPLQNLSILSGNISYPLYMTHYAAIWIFANYYNSYKPSTGQLVLIITAGTLILLGFAYLTMKLYDTPVRNYLKKKIAGN